MQIVFKDSESKDVIIGFQVEVVAKIARLSMKASKDCITQGTYIHCYLNNNYCRAKFTASISGRIELAIAGNLYSAWSS